MQMHAFAQFKTDNQQVMKNKIAQFPMQIECKPVQNELGEERYIIELPVESFNTREVLPLDEQIVLEERNYLDNSPPLFLEFLAVAGQFVLDALGQLLLLVFDLLRVVLGILFTFLGHLLVALGKLVFGLFTGGHPSPRRTGQMDNMSMPSKKQPINIVTINNINVKS